MQQVTPDQLRAERVEMLIHKVDAISDPPTRELVETLLQELLDMYGEGLARMLDLTTRATDAGIELVQSFAHDELIGALLLLHDLHPSDQRARLLRALQELEPHLKAGGGKAELIRLEEGVASVRLLGSCQGCAASTKALKETLNEALSRAVPDLERLEIEGGTDAPSGISAPVTFIPSRRQRKSAPSAVQGQG